MVFVRLQIACLFRIKENIFSNFLKDMVSLSNAINFFSVGFFAYEKHGYKFIFPFKMYKEK